MTTPTAGRRRRDAGPTERTTDQRLATLHLRTGALSLARAELETMAGDGVLDDEALLDLAEVRWRTGDLPGAGEAADAFLAAGHETTLGLVIAAEAQAALGRPIEARRLADRAIRRSDRSLDGLFAGLPISSIWPREVDADLMPQPTATGPVGSATRLGAAAGAHDGSESPAGHDERSRSGSLADRASDGDRPASMPAAAILPDLSRALRAAEEALASDDPSAATIQLALVLRVAPALAPAVLDMIRDREGPSFELIRGDAFRLVGREAEARRSFAAAANVPSPDEPDADPAPRAPDEPGPPSAPAEPDAQLSMDHLEGS
jgi:hypothetical protein